LAWRKLRTENVISLETSPDVVKKIKSRRMRWAGHVGRRGIRVRSCKFSVEKRKGKETLESFGAHERIILIGILEEVRLEGKRPLGRPRRRWVDNIKIDLREIGWNGGDWIDLTQDRDQWRALVKAVMNLRVP
jgi:hypothetical protein